MQISRRVTNGLAWAGLLIVVGVPSADVITAQFVGNPASHGDPGANVAMLSGPVVIDTKLAEPTGESTKTDLSAAGATEPVVAVDEASADPVEAYLDSGRKLPGYISAGNAAPTETASVPDPKPTEVTTPTVEESTAVAEVPTDDVSPRAVNEDARQAATHQSPTIDSDPGIPGEEIVRTASRQPPVPMPLSMRPEPSAQALVIPEREQYPVVDSAPVPPAEVAAAAGYATSEDLENWEYGPLSDFLERRNGQSAELVEPGYESGGFFLDEGPGNSRAEFRREYTDPDRVVRVYPIY